MVRPPSGGWLCRGQRFRVAVMPTGHLGSLTPCKPSNNNNDTFTWSGPSEVMTAPDNGPDGRLTGWCSRRPPAMQTVMICRRIVITLARPGGPSKHCRKDLAVPSLLNLGLLPFLIFCGCAILQSSSSLVRTSPPKLRLVRPHEDRNSLRVPAHHHASFLMARFVKS
jgi:hypothetical protein